VRECYGQQLLECRRAKSAKPAGGVVTFDCRVALVVSGGDIQKHATVLVQKVVQKTQGGFPGIKQLVVDDGHHTGEHRGGLYMYDPSEASAWLCVCMYIYRRGASDGRAPTYQIRVVFFSVD
jgi:hypothetical protein